MITLTYEDNFSRKAREYLDKVAHDSSVLTGVNNIIGTHLNQFVPMQSGALRGSMYADANGVHWNAIYAHYQYMGIVYAENKAIYNRGRIVGWKSPPGKGTKVPTGRKLGLPGYRDGWTFGYTTPGTHHHWDEIYTKSAWVTGTNLKAQINLEITKYIKRIANMYFAFR